MKIASVVSGSKEIKMKRLLSLIRENTLSTAKVRVFVFAVFLAILIVLPALIHNQWITGSLVNAILLLSAILIGPMEAVILGLMPSVVALSTGLLPLPMAPMIPFIMIGNALLIVAFCYLRNQNYAFRLGISALLKFALLHFVVTFAIPELLEDGVFAKLFVMMSWPQLITAVVGGIIIYPIIKTKES